MSDNENHGGPRDMGDVNIDGTGTRSISEIFGTYNVLGSDVQIILDGRPVTGPSPSN